MPGEWKTVDFLFQLTDDEVRAGGNRQFDFESKNAFNGAVINSYLFFAIELKGNHYSRSALAGITREVNKLFDMPALILFRYGETLTLAVNRAEYLAERKKMMQHWSDYLEGLAKGGKVLAGRFGGLSGSSQ